MTGTSCRGPPGADARGGGRGETEVAIGGGDRKPRSGRERWPEARRGVAPEPQSGTFISGVWPPHCGQPTWLAGLFRQLFCLSAHMCQCGPGTGTVPRGLVWMEVGREGDAERVVSVALGHPSGLLFCFEEDTLPGGCAHALNLAPGHSHASLFPECVQSGAGRGRSEPPGRPARAAFAYFGSTGGQAVGLNNPRENHLAKRFISKQFTFLVFNKLLPRRCAWSQAWGWSLFPWPAQCPAPTPGVPRPGFCSHLIPNNLGRRLRASAMVRLPARVPRPAVPSVQLPPAGLALGGTPHASGLGMTCPDLQADRPACRSPGGPILCIFFQQSSSETSKALRPEGCQRKPLPLESQLTPSDSPQHLMTASATET